MLRKLDASEKNYLNEFLKTSCYEIKGDTKIMLNINEIFDKSNITSISRHDFITQLLPILEDEGFMIIDKGYFAVTLNGISHISSTYSIPETKLGILSTQESIFYMKKILEKIRDLSKNKNSINVTQVREDFRIIDDISFQHLIDQLYELGYIQITDNILRLL